MRTLPLVYYPSRSKLAYVALCGVASVLVGVWIITDPSPPPLYVRIVGWIGVSFFGCSLLYALFRFARPRPSVVLDASGVHDNASLVAGGFVPWSDVDSVAVFSVMNQKMVGLELKDNQAFLSRVSAWRRGMAQLNLKMGYPVIAIPESAISVTAEQLASDIAQTLPA